MLAGTPGHLNVACEISPLDQLEQSKDLHGII